MMLVCVRRGLRILILGFNDMRRVMSVARLVHGIRVMLLTTCAVCYCRTRDVGLAM